MQDGLHEAHAPLSAEALDEAERRALIAAVAEARADPRPDVPHEEVRAEILAEIEELERRLTPPPGFGRKVVSGFLVFLILSASFMATCILQPATAQETTKVADLPPDVIEFISRRTSCIDSIAKSQANPSQAAAYAQVMSILRCDDISSEHVALRSLYQTDTHVAEALDHTWIKIVQRVPVHIDPADTERRLGSG